jgi:hypothetical protein
MTKPRPKRKPRRPAKVLKALRRENIHPDFGAEKSMVLLALEPSQLAGLKKLARERGTTVAEQISHAVNAYVLDVTSAEIRWLNAMLDRLHATMHKNRQAIEETLQEIARRRFPRPAPQERTATRASRRRPR